MQEYSSIYRQLRDTEARFIRLQPGRWGDPIICELIYLRIDDPPKYIALSYAWGDSTDTEEISLSDQPFQINRSLFTALQQLRYFLTNISGAPEAFAVEGILFWADAICINQASLDEKSVQVPRMNYIYSLAELVLAWLGKNEEEDEVVCKIMQMASPINLDYTVEDFDKALLNEPGCSLDSFVRVLGKLLDRPWFYRVWVIQKVVLARKDPIFLAGRYWCDIDELWFIWSFISSFPKYHSETWAISHGTRLSTYGLVKDLLRTIWKAFELSIESEEGDMSEEEGMDEVEDTSEVEDMGEEEDISEVEDISEEKIESLMSRYIAHVLSAILGEISESLEAAVEHDYIYGLLSMINVPDYPGSLVPDYRKPFEKVFHTYARVIIEETGNLSIIPRRYYNLVDVPSWVPDFRARRTDMGHDFHSKPEIRPLVEFSTDGMKLKTDGVNIGEVVAIYTSSQQNRDNTQEVIQEVRQFDTFLQLAANLRETSVENVTSEWLDLLFGNTDNFVSMSVVKEFHASALTGLPLPLDGRHDQFILEVFRQKLCGFWVFLTSTGLLGRLVRRDGMMQKGDVLAIMKLTTDPFVLRPTTNTDEYTLVGNCRVSGEHRQADFNEEFFSQHKLQDFILI